MNKQRRTRLLTLHARFSALCDELEPICEEEQTAADALTEYFETVQADDAQSMAEALFEVLDALREALDTLNELIAE